MRLRSAFLGPFHPTFAFVDVDLACCGGPIDQFFLRLGVVVADAYVDGR